MSQPVSIRIRRPLSKFEVTDRIHPVDALKQIALRNGIPFAPQAEAMLRALCDSPASGGEVKNMAVPVGTSPPGFVLPPGWKWNV